MEKREESEDGRQSFVTVLRILGTCAVVMLHTVTGVMDQENIRISTMEYRVFLLIMDMVTWGVPVFLLISGYLFLNPEKKITAGKMLGKYCRRIVLALFLFGVPYAGMELVLKEKTFRMDMVGQALWMVLKGESWAHMWYLYMILLLYIITPGLRWGLQRTPRLLVYVFLGILLLETSVLPFANLYLGREVFPVLPGDGIYLFYYLCGYVFVGVAEQKPPVVWSVFGLGLLVFLGMLLNRIIWGFSLRVAYQYPFTVLLALLLFWMGKQAEGRKILRRDSSRGGRAEKIWWKKRMGMFVERLEKLCFAIYLIHPVFINLCYKVFHWTPLDACLVISLPCFFLLFFTLSVVGAWMLHQVPVLRKYVL